MEVPWTDFIRFARKLNIDLSSYSVMPEEKVWHIDQFRRWLDGFNDLPSYVHYIRYSDVLTSIKAGSRNSSSAPKYPYMYESSNVRVKNDKYSSCTSIMK
jgi:hypothetical protein